MMGIAQNELSNYFVKKWKERRMKKKKTERKSSNYVRLGNIYVALSIHCFLTFNISSYTSESITIFNGC